MKLCSVFRDIIIISDNQRPVQELERSLDSVMKTRAESGFGLVKKQAQIITLEEEEKLEPEAFGWAHTTVNAWFPGLPSRTALCSPWRE
jgi:hypothetical protein